MSLGRNLFKRNELESNLFIRVPTTLEQKEDAYPREQSDAVYKWTK